MNASGPLHETDLARQVRGALSHLYDPAYLSRHPLARFGLTGEPAARGSDARLGNLLRDRLLAAIEATRPGKGVAATSKLWRTYRLLQARYVEALETHEVQRQLSLSKSTYYVEHEQALEAVAAAFSAEVPLGPAAVISRTVPEDLPTYLTSFIGRDQALIEAGQLLKDARLLTLTGAGGTGKTRLAVELARNVAEDYPGGVRLADLAVLREDTLVLRTVMSAFRIEEERGRPMLSTLIDALRPLRCLLVLDNCEHLLDATAGLAETLLKACPGLRIVATSRESLGVQGEVIWQVHTLATPDPADLPPLHVLADVDSVQLFAARARAIHPGFALTADNAAAVAEVCHQLDGIPLAIELAAAQLKALSARQIAGHLDDRFGLLTSGTRTALPRHQTLRALVDWSYGTLSEPERQLFRRLSVFAGGCTLEAIEGVCAGEGIAAEQVVQLLQQLVAKSLVVATEDETGNNRYTLLETLRQYAHEELAAGGELDATQDAHAAYYMHLARSAADELKGAGQLRALAVLDVEHQNLRAVLGTCRRSAAGSPERGRRGLELAEALWWYWYVRNHWSEALEWLISLTRAVSNADGDVASRALVKAAWLAWEQGDVATAQRLEAEGGALALETGGDAAVGWSSLLGAIRLIYIGQHGRAVAGLEAAVACFERTGLAWETAISRTFLGGAALFAGDSEQALTELGLALNVMREIGEHWGIAYTLLYLGLAAMWRSDFAQAREYLLEGAEVADELGNSAGGFEVETRLGQLELLEGNIDAAGQRFVNGLRFRRRIRRWGVALTLTGLAAVAAAQDQSEVAVELFAAASSLRDRLGSDVAAFERDYEERQLAALRRRLGSATFAASWDRGYAMDEDAVVLKAESVISM
ncbi:MAG TPA: AAA family ATPase [Chloroflexota bacterium]|nr:AAA family ATPase [Chloroflexota bacterium]